MNHHYALSLTQPWASLMADGRKTIETRSWSAPNWVLGKDVVIHAAKSIDKPTCTHFGYDPATIARGVCLCIVRLDACLRTPLKWGAAELVWGHKIPVQELDYGDFSDGRFLWLTSNLRPIDPPVPAKGHLSVWSVSL